MSDQVDLDALADALADALDEPDGWQTLACRRCGERVLVLALGGEIEPESFVCGLCLQPVGEGGRS